MATPKLDLDDDLDDVPLTKRRIRMKSNPKSLNTPHPHSNDSPVDFALKRVRLDPVKEWPGLPRGVKFSPSDEDLLWHLLVKLGKGKNDPHPFIHQFITCLDDIDAFGHVHPINLPGIKRDGSDSFFFHRTIKAFDSGNKNVHAKKKNDCDNLYWCETGESKQIVVEGEHQGTKKKMIFWMSMKEGEEPVASNWVMHQYHLGSTGDAGEFAVSRMFYKLRSSQTDKHIENTASKTFETVSFHGDAVISAKPVKHEADEECQQDNLISKIPAQENSSGSSLFHNSRAHSGSIATDVLENMSLFEETNVSDGIPWEASNDNANLPVLQMLRLNYECGPLSSGSSVHLVNMKEVAIEDVLANKIFETNRDTDLTVNERGFNDDTSTNCSLGNISYSHNPLTQNTYSQEHHMGYNCLIQAHVSRDIVLSPRLPGLNDSIGLQNFVFPSNVKVKTEPLEQDITNHALDVAAGETTSSTGICCPSSGNLLNCTTSFSHPTILSFSSARDNTCQENILPYCNSLPEGTDCSSHTSPTEKLLFSTDKSLDSVLPPVGPTVVKSEKLGTSAESLQSTFPKPDVPLAKEGCLPNIDCNKRRNQPKQDKQTNSTSNSEEAQRSRFSIRKKRKKTATNSVETALEEDAPGLLQVLLDKGIIVDEMKLYGSKDDDDDDALDISSEDENFDDLESVISKLFTVQASLPKFSVARLVKGSKAFYCLSCLISLIEQARYLQFRDSPVEWGWCRDLQSFIFVFQWHNRIVVERPEYGYATYFFELVHSLPVDWQVKRLVIAMKLSSCSRSTLLENKPLLIGEDLTEGEACILEEYGWMPNCGLGTMLNYCDRVVHDKRNERHISEWRAKIGKLLMDGHDGGRTELVHIPKKAVGCMATQDPEIKVEY